MIFLSTLETILSTLGVANCLFWLAILAAVYCGIIKPEFKPDYPLRKQVSYAIPKSVDRFFF
jgi:hypothetical protein